MSKIVHFDVKRGITIMDGFESDKPSFGMRVELEEGDDFATEVATAIDTVNSVMMLIPESEAPED
jgi:hypothetical protein